MKVSRLFGAGLLRDACCRLPFDIFWTIAIDYILIPISMEAYQSDPGGLGGQI